MSANGASAGTGANTQNTVSGADTVKIQRALVSVYDKTGLEELVRGLHEAGVAMVSTGNSAFSRPYLATCGSR